jgi:hypothetical protein
MELMFLSKLKKISKKFKRRIKVKRCNHEWNHFDSGYKQCINCKTIEES